MLRTYVRTELQLNNMLFHKITSGKCRGRMV